MPSLVLLALVALQSSPEAEARVVAYLRAHVTPGQPVLASRLASEVFTGPEERAALDRLFNVFFKLPLFAAQHQRRSGRPPTLDEIAGQFALKVPGEADLLLRIMEADPRMPRFLERDAKTGEITKLDVEAVLAHPRFGRELERTLLGLEGQPAPAFTAQSFAGAPFSSAALAGRAHVVYFWFSNCPPCMQTAPLLVALAQARGLPVVAVNADRLLELEVSDAERAEYAAGLTGFTLLHATEELRRDYGGVSVYPTLFFVDRAGRVARQLVNRQERAALEAALEQASQ